MNKLPVVQVFGADLPLTKHPYVENGCLCLEFAKIVLRVKWGQPFIPTPESICDEACRLHKMFEKSGSRYVPPDLTVGALIPDCSLVWRSADGLFDGLYHVEIGVTPKHSEAQQVNATTSATVSAGVQSAKLTIAQAAEFCGCDERTIRNRLEKRNHDGTPLIAGVIGTGRLTRIPRESLEPFRSRLEPKPVAAKKGPRKRSVKNDR